MSSAAGRDLGAGQCGQGVGSLGRMGSGAAWAGGQWGSVAQAGQAGCGQQRQGAGRSQGRAQAAEVAAGHRAASLPPALALQPPGAAWAGSGRPQGHCPARELLRGSALFGEAPCQGGVAVLCATHHCNTWQCSNCHLWRLCPIPGRSAGDLASQGEYSLSCSLAIQPSPLSCCVH